jgi:TRAP-type C4-dicarboxylate transport system substrate-binding protein
MKEKWQKAPGGGATLTIFNGSQGGEADMVRKMKNGLLQAAMLSVVGLAEIDKSVSALQYMPMMFRSLEEVDHVRDKLAPTLEKRLLAKDFVVLFVGKLDANKRPLDLVRAMAGRNDDRNIRMGADFPQHIQPILLAEPQIQNDQAGHGPVHMTIEFSSV